MTRWQTLPGASIHLYGKGEARPGRKMGHVTRVLPKACIPGLRQPMGHSPHSRLAALNIDF